MLSTGVACFAGRKASDVRNAYTNFCEAKRRVCQEWSADEAKSPAKAPWLLCTQMHLGSA